MKRNVILSIIIIIVKMMKNNLLLMLIEINKDSPKYIFGLGPSTVDTKRQLFLCLLTICRRTRNDEMRSRLIHPIVRFSTFSSLVQQMSTKALTICVSLPLLLFSSGGTFVISFLLLNRAQDMISQIQKLPI